jgi:membrane-bound lytic murein transglycosylase B
MFRMDSIAPRMILGICLAVSQAANAEWDACIDNLRATAVSQGISNTTVNLVFADIKELPRVIQHDRSQPEFTQTFTQYYQQRVTDFRVTQGRNLRSTHAPLLSRIQDLTGVPPQYLVAFWGLETNFGKYFGKLSIPSALATLACDSRRSAFFTSELLATLQIVDAGDIAADELLGSWAGAIGHMQFMPTTYLQHAIDGDGDGKKDLLGSIPDALTSGAWYLSNMGWQAGYRWGREVQLPANFDYSVTGSDQWRPLREWAEMGVSDSFGEPLSSEELSSALLLPSGHRGPAFLVYPNFRVIMRWNRSEYYALAVGRLADRIAGAGRLDTPLLAIADARFSTQAFIDLQAGLNKLGFEAGKPDGVLGPATRLAIRSFQQQHGQIADGYPSDALFAAVANRVSEL